MSTEKNDKVAMPGDPDESFEKMKRAAKPARKVDKDEKDEEGSETDRGTLTPVQYEDDGWNDLPVQMRE